MLHNKRKICRDTPYFFMKLQQFENFLQFHEKVAHVPKA